MTTGAAERLVGRPLPAAGSPSTETAGWTWGAYPQGVVRKVCDAIADPGDHALGMLAFLTSACGGES